MRVNRLATLQIAAALNSEGTDYLLLADAPPEATLAPALETLRQLSYQFDSAVVRGKIR